MNHLTVDEIIDFVSLTELNNEAIELSSTVNGHIRKCEKCLKLVRAFQMIYDEFTKLNSGKIFKNYFLENFSEEMLKNENIVGDYFTDNELDGFK